MVKNKPRKQICWEKLVLGLITNEKWFCRFGLVNVFYRLGLAPKVHNWFSTLGMVNCFGSELNCINWVNQRLTLPVTLLIKMPESGVGSIQWSTEGCLSLKVVLHRDCLGRRPPKVVFHRRSSSTEGCLPPKVVFHRRSSSTKGCLPLKVVFHQRLSSNEGRLPAMIVFHWRLSPIKGYLPWKVVFHQRLSPT